MKMRFKNVTFGLILIVIAALLIANQLGYTPIIQGLGLFQYCILAVCTISIVSGIMNFELWSAAFGAGIGYYVLSGPMEWPHINLWILLLAIFVAGSGIYMIFHGRKGYKKHINIEVNSSGENSDYVAEQDHIFGHDDSGAIYDNYLKADLVFSSMTKYVDSKDFTGGKLDLVFSNMKLYFDNTQLHDNEAVINIENVFSTVDLYVPKSWSVQNDGNHVFGGPKGSYRSTPDAPLLIIHGDNVFSRVNIHRI